MRTCKWCREDFSLDELIKVRGFIYRDDSGRIHYLDSRKKEGGANAGTVDPAGRNIAEEGIKTPKKTAIPPEQANSGTE
jgi:hypothetical protein